ncbi:hypothetical protein P8625_00390 [Tenacibaculum tangerinum]|uniref:Uncharacterized protein n=1 Tax=Tenacibaculum tangerinum TaxID=3038772 RepID=A0ABY8L2Q7_9FLAO|nr:hypothetical protein [Tenacibaculum tangerinum]WGH75655.1 hypothetical protein P8625_00390 [Tenacibaculum tangerinum]
MNKAFFPISVDNKNYSSKNLSALIKIILELDDCRPYFLIADNLQLYNKVKQTNKELSFIVQNFKTKNQYFPERVKWINKVFKRDFPQIDESVFKKWKIKNVSEITDHKFFNIYRSLLILFNVDDEFRNDLSEAAENHTIYESIDSTELQIRLNRLYVLEEIAINLRMRVFNKLYSEYYLGQLPSVLTKIYYEKYSLNIKDLTGKNLSGLDFKFYEGKVEFDNIIWNKINHIC